MCLGGGSVPQAPDTSGQQAGATNIGNAAAAAGNNQLNWANSQVGSNTATAANLQGSLSPQVGTDVGANATGANMYGSTVGALGNQLQTAQSYGDVAGQNSASANAMAGTAQSYNAARMNNMRQLGSYGVDPSQMKSGALNLNANLAQAGAVGNAGYQAGQQRQLTGMGLVSNALNQNLMGTQVGQGYGAGANATGSTVSGIGNNALSTGSSALTAPSTMMNTGLSGFNSSANIANQNFQDQMQSYNASQAGSNSLMSGLGSVAGIAAMAMMRDGGAIPGRYDNGGSVPTGSNVLPVMSGGSNDKPSSGGTSGFFSGLSQGANSGIGQSIGTSMAQHQATAQMPQTQQLTQDPAVQQQLSDRAMAATAPTFSNGGIPQRKRPDYGNPAVQHDQQPMAPPLVNIPGPWVGANGGGPTHPPGMIQHGPTDGTGIDDQVHAKVSVGEYIIPADVVHAKGKEFFDKLLQRYHVPAEQQRQQMGAMH